MRTKPQTTGPEAAARTIDDHDPFRNLAGPVPVDIAISFHAEAAPAAGQALPAEAMDVETDLQPEAMARLRALDSKVMAWLAASDANRLLFISDPLAALVQIESSLDKSFVKQLQRARQDQAEAAAIDPRIRLRSVQVKAVPAVANPRTK